MVRLALVFVCFAPVPPSRALTADLLIGQWDMTWGSSSNWRIVFLEDGRYFCGTSPGSVPGFTGRYAVYRGVLYLNEGMTRQGDEAAELTSRYVIDLTTSRYPTLAGRTCGSTLVVLTNPQR